MAGNVCNRHFSAFMLSFCSPISNNLTWIHCKFPSSSDFLLYDTYFPLSSVKVFKVSRQTSQTNGLLFIWTSFHSKHAGIAWVCVCISKEERERERSLICAIVKSRINRIRWTDEFAVMQLWLLLLVYPSSLISFFLLLWIAQPFCTCS